MDEGTTKNKAAKGRRTQFTRTSSSTAPSSPTKPPGLGYRPAEIRESLLWTASPAPKERPLTSTTLIVITQESSPQLRSSLLVLRTSTSCFSFLQLENPQLRIQGKHSPAEPRPCLLPHSGMSTQPRLCRLWRKTLLKTTTTHPSKDKQNLNK